VSAIVLDIMEYCDREGDKEKRERSGGEQEFASRSESACEKGEVQYVEVVAF
jgi:hypothetical protein